MPVAGGVSSGIELMIKGGHHPPLVPAYTNTEKKRRDGPP